MFRTYHRRTVHGGLTLALLLLLSPTTPPAKKPGNMARLVPFFMSCSFPGLRFITLPRTMEFILDYQISIQFCLETGLLNYF